MEVSLKVSLLLPELWHGGIFKGFLAAAGIVAWGIF